MDTLSAASTEYVQVVVSARENGAFVDLSATDVEMGFSATSATPTWRTASWDVDTSTRPAPTYRAQCLVGPDGGVETLAPGTYWVWVKIEDNPATIIRQASLIRVA